jgi:hypothetical protein
VQIDVRIEGLERLQAGVAAGPATLAAEVRGAMTAGSLLIEGAARGLAPKDTGRLAGSITHAISGGGANLQSKIGPSVAYGLYVEKGRGAGKPMPPAGAMAAWMARKGIPASASYVLRRSIGRKGIKARPYMLPAFQQNQGRVTALFMKIGVKVVSRMAG